MKELESVTLAPSQTPHPDIEKILIFMKHSPAAAIAPGFQKDEVTGERIPYEMIAYDAFD